MRIKTHKRAILPLVATLVTSVLLSPFTAHADARNMSEQAAVITTDFNQAELEQMLAPIALYPDTLLTHILIAATYPIEVIDAERFVRQHEGESEQELMAKAEPKDWDPSVKALVAFPRILKNLSEDLGWMRKLGDAFLQDESQVLASIQSLRQKADQAGNLAQMDNVEIVREKHTIVIEPAHPEVVYVPYYDSRVVYGNWHWSHYPPVYWHRPIHYSYYHGPFYWHSGVHIAFDFFFSAFHWSDHHVVRHHHKKRYYHSNRRIATSHEAKRWHHNPKHRKGVAYRNKKMKQRYLSHRPSQANTMAERHRQLKQVNKAVHPNKKGKFVSNKHQQFKQQMTRKQSKKFKASEGRNHHSLAKVERGDKFTSTPGRIGEKKQIKQKNYQGKQKVRQVDNRQDTWKKQPRVKMVTPKREVERAKQVATKQRIVVPHKKHISPGVDNSRKISKPTYRAQGGHSNKQYARVANKRSNGHKSAVKRREKHH
ncbi:DUF3300 domain-containing protein [Thalassotalea sp. G2M2-11]|uniref:DUF3300 domain-containing protein n=1 Tax=Thalassotalea sp. G2M2-11 TaxID=2787627 RepID=UPI001F4A09B6|nr:DUF3300 domain-containing protein [Thalassotalea sp. G2M2-11]